MITTLFYLALNGCPQTILINQSRFPWNSFDQQTITRAKKRCAELYKYSECLKRFYKVRELDYIAICGKRIK